MLLAILTESKTQLYANFMERRLCVIQFLMTLNFWQGCDE